MSPGALVLAAAIPVLFLHVHYQPGFGVGFGSTTLNAYLSDFAVLAVVVVALWSGFRDGFAPLVRGRWLWLAAGALPRSGCSSRSRTATRIRPRTRGTRTG